MEDQLEGPLIKAPRHSVNSNSKRLSRLDSVQVPYLYKSPARNGSHVSGSLQSPARRDLQG